MAEAVEGPTRSLGIAGKLALISAAVRFVSKDGLNTFHKYSYASAAGTLSRVNEARTDFNVAVVDTLVTVLRNEMIDKAKGGQERYIEVELTLTLQDAESGERAHFRGLGAGTDSGDKAIMKAITAAHKYAYALGLGISWGDDPEADAETDARGAGKGKGSRSKSGAASQVEAPPQSPETAQALLAAARLALAEVKSREELQGWVKGFMAPITEPAALGALKQDASAHLKTLPPPPPKEEAK